MMHLFNLKFRMSGDSSPQASATSQPAPTFGFVFDGIFIYKAKAIIHGVFSVRTMIVARKGILMRV